uniref:Large ribosomal subunit protein bL33c n=1 Tax=Polysiphonia scopulorum TaxID=257860 RepID=A0A1Z1MIB5_9FLOR|nr:ribosomal protein L33 [Polysiphonia scopulorum]ARW65592.1 ribosomal protein L33 [Polysiphonia scopulorum]
MGKNKGSRIIITLECECKNSKDIKRTNGIGRYTSSKNKRNTPSRLEIKKFCKYCNQHVTFKEIK